MGLPVITFTASQYSPVNPGDAITLSWTVTGSESQVIDEGIGDVDAIGSVVVNPTVTTYYHLTATNASGSITAYVLVEVWGGPSAMMITHLLVSARKENVFPVRNSF
jgi:hypothetical protein